MNRVAATPQSLLDYATREGLACTISPAPKLPGVERLKAAKRLPRKNTQRQLVEPAFSFDYATKVATWTIPLYVVAGDNARGMGSKIGRAGHEREVVGFALARELGFLARYAKAIQRGEPVKVTLTKLGGGRLDVFDNGPASMKYVLDTVALFLGVRDSNPALHAAFRQLPGKRVHGVQVILESMGTSNDIREAA